MHKHGGCEFTYILIRQYCLQLSQHFKFVAVCRGFLPHYGFVPEGLHSELTADLQRLMSERTRTDSNNDPVIDEDMVFILATKTRNMNS